MFWRWVSNIDGVGQICAAVFTIPTVQFTDGFVVRVCVREKATEDVRSWYALRSAAIKINFKTGRQINLGISTTLFFSSFHISYLVLLLWLCFSLYSFLSSLNPIWVLTITCLHFILPFHSSLRMTLLPCLSVLPIPLILFAFFLLYALAAIWYSLSLFLSFVHLSIHTYLVHAPAPITLSPHLHRE